MYPVSVLVLCVLIWQRLRLSECIVSLFPRATKAILSEHPLPVVSRGEGGRISILGGSLCVKTDKYVVLERDRQRETYRWFGRSLFKWINIQMNRFGPIRITRRVFHSRNMHRVWNKHEDYFVMSLCIWSTLTAMDIQSKKRSTSRFVQFSWPWRICIMRDRAPHLPPPPWISRYLRLRRIYDMLPPSPPSCTTHVKLFI